MPGPMVGYRAPAKFRAVLNLLRNDAACGGKLHWWGGAG